MKSFEQPSLPEKNNKPENAPIDSLENLRKVLGEKEEPEEQKGKSMTIGQMEDFREFLKSASINRILGRNFGYTYSSEFERAQKEDSLILDFLKAEPGLDSNTKRKLYNQIIEREWKPKIDQAVNQLQNNI